MRGYVPTMPYIKDAFYYPLNNNYIHKMTSLTSVLSSVGHDRMHEEEEEEAQVQGCRATPRETET